MPAQLRFLGAAGMVTGSQFLVTVDGFRLLVDCGMFQGSPEEVARNRVPFDFDVGSIGAVLLTHAHLDHCGRIPALVKAGFDGPIYATAATADLAAIVLRDSAKLQEEAAARWARRHADDPPPPDDEPLDLDALPDRIRRAPPVGETRTREALYTTDDAERAIGMFRDVRYDEPTRIGADLVARFRDAGHILGSAIIELDLPGGASGESRTVVFSGDLGRPDTPILRDPTPIRHADYLVMESTYGNREHEPREEAIEALAAVVNEVAGGSGVLLVPAFAIGRTQELVYVLDRLVAAGRIPRMPLFLDSPMASRASDVYLRHPEVFDPATLALVKSGDTPLEYPGERYTNSVDDSKAIRHSPRPFMIVAASGMLTGGRIMHHLRDFVGDPAATLLFIGYQGEGTLGRHIQDGAGQIRLDGRQTEVRCRVRTVSGFSAHADEHELVAWLGSIANGDGRDRRPRRVFLVHGESEPAEALRSRIQTELGLSAELARYRETVDLV
ncbi:MAG: MBL fold metallo-hydrolase [Chloroflexota bacterium]|nr:MBL fold metallo-hydrolase [Chloroflexota bacterium]